MNIQINVIDNNTIIHKKINIKDKYFFPRRSQFIKIIFYKKKFNDLIYSEIRFRKPIGILDEDSNKNKIFDEEGKVIGSINEVSDVNINEETIGNLGKYKIKRNEMVSITYNYFNKENSHKNIINQDYFFTTYMKIKPLINNLHNMSYKIHLDFKGIRWNLIVKKDQNTYLVKLPESFNINTEKKINILANNITRFFFYPIKIIDIRFGKKIYIIKI